MNRSVIVRFQAIVRLIVATSAVAISMGIFSARGELLFSDSFDYSAGPLAGQGPPVGAPPGQTGWSLISGNPQVVPHGLRYPMVISAGRAVALWSGASDHAAANLTPVTGGVVWLGFLIEGVDGSGRGFAVINLGSETDAVTPGFGVLYNARVFGIDNDVAGEQAYTNVLPGSTPAWLVVKLDFTAGVESLYVNPASSSAPVPDATLAMTAEFQASGFDEVFLNVGSSNKTWKFDEVRIGTTFGDIRTGH